MAKARISVKIDGRKRHRIVLILFFSVLLIVAFMISIIVGTLQFSVHDILNVFSGRCEDALTQQVIWNVRLPRTLVAMLVGINMGIAGSLLQGLLRNPLASPNIIGVNSGAGLAAVIIMCNHPGNIRLLPPGAFAGALVATLLIYLLSRREGTSSALTLILAGVALGALLNAFSSAIMILNSDALGVTKTWLTGSLTGRGWQYLNTLLPYSLVGGLAAIALGPRINLFLLGEEMGKNLGLSTEISRLLIILSSTVLAGSAVSVAGMIGFIGIIAPHIARYLVGNDYRFLALMSGIMGGLILLLSDTAARTLFQPFEIPVGIITAMLGAPFFFFLLRNRKKEQLQL